MPRERLTFSGKVEDTGAKCFDKRDVAAAIGIAITSRFEGANRVREARLV
jgi:hypothetical protein